MAEKHRAFDPRPYRALGGAIPDERRDRGEGSITYGKFRAPLCTACAAACTTRRGSRGSRSAARRVFAWLRQLRSARRLRRLQAVRIHALRRGILLPAFGRHLRAGRLAARRRRSEPELADGLRLRPIGVRRRNRLSMPRAIDRAKSAWHDVRFGERRRLDVLLRGERVLHRPRVRNRLRLPGRHGRDLLHRQRDPEKPHRVHRRPDAASQRSRALLPRASRRCWGRGCFSGGRWTGLIRPQCRLAFRPFWALVSNRLRRGFLSGGRPSSCLG